MLTIVFSAQFWTVHDLHSLIDGRRFYRVATKNDLKKDFVISFLKIKINKSIFHFTNNNLDINNYCPTLQL